MYMRFRGRVCRTASHRFIVVWERPVCSLISRLHTCLVHIKAINCFQAIASMDIFVLRLGFGCSFFISPLDCRFIRILELLIPDTEFVGILLQYLLFADPLKIHYSLNVESQVT